jgi:cell volume regulation protein A
VERLGSDDVDFFGEFQIDPSKTLADLKKAYDIALPTDKPDTTIESFMIEHLGGRAEIGDRVACGPVELIVREVSESGGITTVGLALDRHTTPRIRISWSLNLRELFGAVRARTGLNRKFKR